MPVVYFKGGVNDEQAKGAKLDNGVMQFYAIRRDDPTKLIFLGGHRVDDAPTYNTSDAKIAPEYVRRNGRNVVVERQLSSDYVKSMEWNMMLPDRLVSVTDFIYQNQNKCKYDLAIIPLSCDDACDKFFWLGDDLRFGSKQMQNTPVGYDDNEAPINMQRVARTAGQLMTYKGLQLSQFADATQAMYAIKIIEDENGCDGCGCPYQVIVRGGAAPALGYPVLEYTDDGGLTWNTITTTGLDADSIITDIEYINGYLVVSYSDVANATGTDGGVAYSLGVGPAMTASTMDVASAGIQGLIIVKGRLYAFGTDGELYESCDNGINFVQMTVPATFTETVIEAAYDTEQDFLFFACDNASAWMFDGNAFTDLSAEIAPTAATALNAVYVWRSKGVAFGGADGMIYENWSFEGTGTGNWVVGDFGSSVGALVGDGLGYRSLAGVTTSLYIRDLNTLQQWETLITQTGNITALDFGNAMVEEGVNFFVGVTDTGETFQVAKCELCLGDCLTSAVA